MSFRKVSGQSLMLVDVRAAIKPFVLTLDVGTSSVRAALYDAVGREIESTSARIVRSLETTPDGGAEINADAAIAQVIEIIDASLARAGTLASHIEAVAVASFWHSLVGVDDRGRAVTPVFGWAETRAAKAAAQLRQRLDEKSSHARTGCRFHASYWPAKLAWLREDHSELYRAATRWLSFSDYLALCLLGETQTSVSMASGTGLFNQARCEWDETLLKELCLECAQLPLIAGTDDAFNHLGKTYAKRWPQLEGAGWFLSIGDGAANNVGAGCVTKDRAALMIGTSGAMRVMFEGAASELPEGLWCYRADRRRVLTGGALSDGGGLYGWMKESLALTN
ncbi:MAG: FGGY family carbohydrate kinase [Pyrinomonadaceae bacterium]